MNFNSLVRKKVIDIGIKYLYDGNLDVVNEVLRKSKVLEELDLRITQLTLADGKFTDALANNNTLKHLSLYSNTISDEGAKRLADALKINKTLKQLYLSGNKIGNDGAKHIADALMENETLEVLHLEYNKIGDKGASSLANCFTVNQSIRHVFLQGNNISDIGAKKLIEALKWNHGIKDLYMGRKVSKYVGVIGGPIAISEHVKAEIEDLLMDPRRQVPHAQMKHAREEIERKEKAMSEEVATLNQQLASTKAEKNAAEAKLKSVQDEREAVERHVGEEVATLKAALAAKDQRIDFMEAAIRSPMEQLRNIIDPVDLTGDENEPSNKRPRVGGTIKSNLAIMHQQTVGHTQRLVQVKQEKNEAETNLRSVQDEKEVVEANLNDTREDLEIANETSEQQLLAADIWQSRFDELKALVAAGKVDGASIAAISNRPLRDGH